MTKHIEDQHLIAAQHSEETAPEPARPGGRHRRPPQPRTLRARSILATTVIGTLALAVCLAFLTACGSSPPPVMQPASPADADIVSQTEPSIAPRPVTPNELAALPPATTAGTVSAAPQDPHPDQIPGERLAQPLRTIPVYASPGGPAIASLPPVQIVSETALPVIAERADWLQVLLPSRPNGRTGWIYRDDNVRTLRTAYRIEVDRARYSLTLLERGRPIGRWTVGIGKPSTPTPVGRTFLLADIRDASLRYSPIVLPTGAHSNVFTTYGGGPGTTGIHTWTLDPSVYGRASSDGCIRIPPDALRLISTTVPVGSPVVIR